MRWLRTKWRLSSNYNVRNFDIVRKGKAIRSGNRSLVFSFSTSMRPCKWFYFEESSSYSQSWQRSVVEGQSNPIYRSFYHTLNLFFQPGSWQLKMTNECSHSKDGSVSFNIYSDAQLSYKTKAYELLLTCKNLWGENKREFKNFFRFGQFLFCHGISATRNYGFRGVFSITDKPPATRQLAAGGLHV